MKAKPRKTSARSTSKQVSASVRSRSVTNSKSQAEPPRKSHERLAPWLELANLLPRPPLPDERKRSPNPLLGMLSLEKGRTERRAESPAEFVHRFENSGVSCILAITASLDLSLLRTNSDQARRFLHLVDEIAETLRTLVAAAAPHVLRAAGDTPLLVNQLYETPATSRSEICIREGRVETDWVDPYKDFLSALEGVEAGRVRQCPECQRFFFALRKDQQACSRRCNSSRRVREWRANQTQYEYRRKLRGAGIEAGKRRKRFTK
jgi:hypothetical protein